MFEFNKPENIDTNCRAIIAISKASHIAMSIGWHARAWIVLEQNSRYNATVTSEYSSKEDIYVFRDMLLFALTRSTDVC
jgi:hypothetical protein